ncbi:MAG: HAD domain-containing protein [Nocardioidaceae bacterium]
MRGTAGGPPIVAVDVDGTLNALSLYPRPGFSVYEVNGYRLQLCRPLGERLTRVANAFGAELVWATTWEDDANTKIAHKVGLPPTLPVIHFTRARPAGLTWKLASVARYVAERPLAWLDDDLDEDAFAWAAARSDDGVPSLLVQTDPLTGVTDDDLDRLEGWLRDLGRSRGIARPS